MPTRQYIGARYVPKFYNNELDTPEWRPNVQYEPLTIVTYSGNSYTSKKEVPANIGSPDLTPEYWASTGDYDAQVANLQNDVNQIKIDMAKKVYSKFVSLQDFDVEGVGDESSKVADAIQYAKDNGIDTIISSTDVSLQDISFDFSLTFDMMGHTIQGIKYDANAYRVNRMFTCSTSGVDITFRNTVFKGYHGTATQSGAKIPYKDYALLNFSNARSVTIEDCVFDTINAQYYDTFTGLYGAIMNVLDVANTRLINNRFHEYHGEEPNVIRCDTLTKYDVNMEMRDCVFKDTYGSALDFIGGNCELSGNVYDWAYAGSAVNCFGKNVHAHDEIFKANFSNAYDISENDNFQGDSCIIENITCRGTMGTFFAGIAKTIRISNIACGLLSRLANVSHGYGGTLAGAETTALDDASMIIENVQADDGQEFALITAGHTANPAIVNNIFNVNVKGVRLDCSQNPIQAANKVRIDLSDCELFTKVRSGYGATPIFAIFTAAQTPNGIMMHNCRIHNQNGANNEHIFNFADPNAIDYLIVDSCYADTSGTDVITPSTLTGKTAFSNNLNLA